MNFGHSKTNSSLNLTCQPLQHNQWGILKSNFIVSALLNMEIFYLNRLTKTGTIFHGSFTVLRSSQIAKLVPKSCYSLHTHLILQYSSLWKKVFGWTITIILQTNKDVYLLHPVIQTIANETSHFV